MKKIITFGVLITLLLSFYSCSFDSQENQSEESQIKKNISENEINHESEISKAITAENYAILISAGYVVQDDAKNHSEYWYDLFLAYEHLVLNEGYSHENIIVFYGDGNDFNTSYPRYTGSSHGWENGIVDFDNSKSTLITEFSNLANIITSNDNLLIWWICGHGRATNPDNYYVIITKSDPVGDSIGEQTICNMIDQLNYNKRLIIWMTCYSGCLIEGESHFNFDRTVILTSSRWDQNSKSAIIEDLPHTELGYCIISALSGETPDGTPYDADLNGDNKISVEELFYDVANNPIISSDPQLMDEDSIAGNMFINNLSGSNANDY